MERIIRKRKGNEYGNEDIIENDMIPRFWAPPNAEIEIDPVGILAKRVTIACLDDKIANPLKLRLAGQYT